MFIYSFRCTYIYIYRFRYSASTIVTTSERPWFSTTYANLSCKPCALSLVWTFYVESLLTHFISNARRGAQKKAPK